MTDLETFQRVWRNAEQPQLGEMKISTSIFLRKTITNLLLMYFLFK